jgi:hypothetical protein
MESLGSEAVGGRLDQSGILLIVGRRNSKKSAEEGVVVVARVPCGGRRRFASRGIFFLTSEVLVPFGGR